MLRLMLLRLIFIFCKCRRSEKDKSCRLACNLLPQGEALHAFLEEVRMLVEVERKVKSTISKETRRFVEGILYPVYILYIIKAREKERN